MKKPLSIALLFAGLLMISFDGSGQIWKRTEDKPEPLWRLRGALSWDFYPFPDLNNERFYNSIWQFNYTAGVELMRTTKEKRTAWGGGLLYSIKDFKQQIRNQDSSNTNFRTVISATHQIRYAEAPILFEYEILKTKKTQIFADGGFVLGFMDKAVSKFTLRNGDVERNRVNDNDFARFLLGVRYGGGFRQFITDELALETGLYGRFFLTDMGKSQYVNFSSLSIRFNLVYEFTNPKPGETE